MVGSGDRRMLGPAEVNVKSTWSVLVVYENEQTREAAVSFCDRLVERFWAKCGFDVNWCSHDDLEERNNSEKLAAKAADADIIVFAHHGEKDFAWPVRIWIETWLTIRGEREGKLVALPAKQGNHRVASATAYLRQIAHRAGMDFVTEVPPSMADALPDSPDVVMNRASHVGSVLDAILHYTPPPRLR